VQLGVTGARDGLVVKVAEAIEEERAELRLLLCASRLYVWWERDGSQVEELSLVMDEALAEQNARELLIAELVVPFDMFDDVTSEDVERLAAAVGVAVSEVDDFFVSQGYPDELPIDADWSPATP
jgi:hypothetical protein